MANRAAVLKPFLEGEAIHEIDELQRQLREVLAGRFELFDNNQVKTAHQAVSEILGHGPCISPKCLRMMRQTLITDTLFVLRVRQLKGTTQLTILQTTGNEMRLLDDFCNNCELEQLGQVLKHLTSELLDPSRGRTVHVLPMDLTLPPPPSINFRVQMPVAPAPPLPPLSPELLYPSIKIDIAGLAVIPKIEFPEQELPLIPDAPRDLSVLVSPQEDILIFPLTPDLVQEARGEFVLLVTAFSEIMSVSVNGEKQPTRPGTYQTKLSVSYELEPGDNSFMAEVQTQKLKSIEEFIVFLETDQIKRKKEKPPFQTIVILEAVQDDNFLSVASGSDKTVSQKSSLTLLETYNKRFDHDSRMAINGLLMGDRYQQNDLASYGVFFKQFSWDWIEKFYLLPTEFKFSLGINTISMYDSTRTSSKRDAQLDYYKQYTSDQFLTIEGTLKTSEISSWKANLDLKNKKNVEDTGENGNETTIGFQYQRNLWGWTHTAKITNSIFDLETETSDYTEQVLNYKLSIPVGSLSLSPLIKQTNTWYRVADNSGIKETSAKQNMRLELTYPATSWLIFSLTPEREQETSNASDFYQKNLASFKMTLIF